MDWRRGRLARQKRIGLDSGSAHSQLPSLSIERRLGIDLHRSGPPTCPAERHVGRRIVQDDLTGTRCTILTKLPWRLGGRQERGAGPGLDAGDIGRGRSAPAGIDAQRHRLRVYLHRAARELNEGTQET